MNRTELVDAVVAAVLPRFRHFGGPSPRVDSPVAAALAERPAEFAIGVPVRDVVEAVIEATAEALRHA